MINVPKSFSAQPFFSSHVQVKKRSIKILPPILIRSIKPFGRYGTIFLGLTTFSFSAASAAEAAEAAEAARER